jgi:hypothetical protein
MENPSSLAVSVPIRATASVIQVSLVTPLDEQSLQGQRRTASSLLSLQRPLRCSALLLPDGPGWTGGLYKENDKTGPDWIKSQVRNPLGRKRLGWSMAQVTEYLPREQEALRSIPILPKKTI